MGRVWRRGVHSSAPVLHDHGIPAELKNKPDLSINWKKKNGEVKTTTAKVGMNLLQAARLGDIDLEGACEGVCACSTCHVIFDDSEVFDNLPESEETEDDMLDQAFGLTATSRLGCQIVLTEEHNNLCLSLPAATRNFYVDGHVPKPH